MFHLVAYQRRGVVPKISKLEDSFFFLTQHRKRHFCITVSYTYSSSLLYVGKMFKGLVLLKSLASLDVNKHKLYLLVSLL